MVSIQVHAIKTYCSTLHRGDFETVEWYAMLPNHCSTLATVALSRIAEKPERMM